MPDYEQLVELKVEASVEVGGWQRGEVSICREARDESLDIAAWLRGLDGYLMSAEQLARVDRIVELAREAHAELLELELSYHRRQIADRRELGSKRLSLVPID
jgi:hypothetical protein